MDTSLNTTTMPLRDILEIGKEIREEMKHLPAWQQRLDLNGWLGVLDMIEDNKKVDENHPEVPASQDSQ